MNTALYFVVFLMYLIKLTIGNSWENRYVTEVNDFALYCKLLMCAGIFAYVEVSLNLLT
jgi:hypothetical protein